MRNALDKTLCAMYIAGVFGDKHHTQTKFTLTKLKQQKNEQAN